MEQFINTNHLSKWIFFGTLVLGCFFSTQSQSFGCTDALAENFDANATANDGSCIYASANVSASNSVDLPTVLNGNSGLIFWNENLWTHNDASDINLYELDPNDVENFTPFTLNETINIDWEEIAQDEDFVYVGDVGNNTNGNRTNLQILRIQKESLLQQAPVIDTIAFSYNLQTDFSPSGANNTNFDCEAFIVSSDQIYLFTKEWVSSKTSVYALPKTPGTHEATYQAEWNVNGLITGATYLENDRLVVLTGYSFTLQPFLYLLYDFENDEFFGGNKRKINLQLPFHQVEGIATNNGLTYSISNEFFSQAGITTQAKLHEVDLSPFLEDYLESLSVAAVNSTFQNHIRIYPNPTSGQLNIHFEKQGNFNIQIYDMSMRKQAEYSISDKENILNLNNFQQGIYIYHIYDEENPQNRKSGKLIIE